MESETKWIVGLALTCVGLFGAWIRSVWRAYHKSELEKVFATRESTDKALVDLRTQINGARQAMRKDMDVLDRRFTRVEAEASLAIKNADTALSETAETRQIVELHHEQMMESFVKPFREQNNVLLEISKALAAQGAILEEMRKGR